MWSRLSEELDNWIAQGQRATFWWRDDDVVDTGPALERLLHLGGGGAWPLSLAAIPAAASSRLAERLETESSVHVLQHGFAHRNHAPPGAKKTELGGDRCWSQVSAQLGEGLERLGQLFAERALPVLVPPWNRLPGDRVAALADLGYRGLSTFGPRRQARPAPALLQANTHLDPIDWRGSRGFVGESLALAAVVDHLRARRLGRVDRAEATGFLTHHLQHDEATWEFCQRLLMETARHPAPKWLSAVEVFEL